MMNGFRRSLRRPMAVLGLCIMPAVLWAQSPIATEKASSLLDVNHPAVVSRSDLIYQSPAARPVEGLPIGNGRMGTLVWTTPDAIRFQINRCDVFAVNKTHNGPQGSPIGPSEEGVDYCGGCAAVSIALGGSPLQAGARFEQRLSIHDAEVSIAASDLRARCFISAVADVLVLEVDDRRPEPQPIRLTVSMWRAPEVKTRDHVARFRFEDTPDAVLVVQRFHERDYHCSSAVAARILGGHARIEGTDQRARTITAPAKRGKSTILISSAASWSPQADVGATAVRLLSEASTKSYDALRQAHAQWWSGFWSRTFVHATSSDGLGDFVSCLRNLHLYHMAATSRGELPPKWNASLFSTDGDRRTWGSQFWVWTTEMLYFPLMAADAIDLTDPYFNMYVRQLPDCYKAAKQRWGVQGAFFPETTPFDGPLILPDDLVANVQDVYLGRKERSRLDPRARAACQFDSSLRAIAEPEKKAAGRYSWISHLVSSGSELAVQAWWRYRYSGDEAWLRRNGYPLLRGTVEFYRHMVKKGADGRYHLSGTNVHEDFWGAKDGIMDLAAIRGTAPLAIRAAEILGVDSDLCSKWKDLLDNLAPYPMGADAEAKRLTGGVLADDVWAAGHLGDVSGSHNPEDVWLNPVFPFEDWTLETRNPATDRIVHKLLDLAPKFRSVLNGGPLGTAIRTPIAWVRAGRGDSLPAVLGSYYLAFNPVANGFSLFEGEHAHSIEHLGAVTMTLQEALLQSVSPRPGEPEVIRVFPAWPKEWEASFRLLARGGFLVTSSIRAGNVEFVEIESRLGGRCPLRNPWGAPCLVVEATDAAREFGDDVIRIDTKRGGRYRILPKGKPAPPARAVSPPPLTGPTDCTVTLMGGKTVRTTLGRHR
ncbi:MAG: glycoside hydrolase N-terminal domain-containing protein [Phycisphaerae bacterium]|nr:glycoside hydrolase N-terminal domain-containing protein [Phycisphaerae bacterium]